MEALQFFLRENVLTDNILVAAPKNYTFKGGYIAYVKEYTFQNAWSDKEQIKRFRSKERLMEHLNKHYSETIEDLDFTNTNLI